MRRYPDELYHFGIKGMKWGVRRFQRRDGTRTSAGKKRYSSKDSQARKERIKRIAKGAAIAGLAIGGTYLAYKNRDKIGGLIRGGSKKGSLTNLNDQNRELRSMLSVDDIVKPDRSKPVRVNVSRVKPDLSYGKLNRDLERGARRRDIKRDTEILENRRMPRTVQRSQYSNKAIERIGKNKRAAEKRAFDDFDKAMMDPGSKLVFGDGREPYFIRSDGSRTKMSFNDRIVGRAKRPPIKGSSVRFSRKSGRLG